MNIRNLAVGKKALINTDQWFVAPDGQQYKAVFGTIKSVLDSTEALGVRTNAKSTNWYVEIGNLTVAGCQIHYAVQTDSCNLNDVMNYEVKDGELVQFMQPTRIYNADEVFHG